MKRFLALLFIVLLLPSCLVGCTPKETDSTTPPASTEQDTGVQYESPEQEAVVKTALAFLARSNRIQYDDTRFSPNSTPVEYRWQHSLKSPEDYTTQFIGFTNCAAFTHDVYLEALDYDILSYTTASLTQKGEPERVYKYFPTGTETAEEMAAMEAEFRSNLKIGDLIVIRYNGSREGSGHAMLYVGAEVLKGNDGYRGTAAESTNDTDNATDELTYDIIHSTGSSYDYGNYTEKSEEYGSVQITSTDALFDPENRRYVFSQLDSIAIVRPLNIYEGGVPEKTQNRIKNMENIVAEKLSSHSYGMTVNPGDEMTFSFSVYNKNEKDVTLEIRDTVPSNTTYVSGAASEENGNVSWDLPVPAKTTVTVSYTVRVNDDAEIGDVVYSDAGTVGGVDVDCPKVYIGNTLTTDEQSALTTAVENLSSDKRGTTLANAIYAEALGTADILPTDFIDLMDDLYTPYGLSQNILNDEGDYLDMIVPGMFGGRYVTPRVEGSNFDRLEAIRTRLPRVSDLIVGDIIIAVDGTDITNASNHRLYLFNGETSLDLMTGETVQSETILNKTLAYNRFAILRPSMVME